MKTIKKYSRVIALGILVTYLGLLSHTSIASVGAYSQSRFAASQQASANKTAFPAAVALAAGFAAWGFATGVATVIGFVNGYADAAGRSQQNQTAEEFKISKSLLLAQATNFEKFDN